MKIYKRQLKKFKYKNQIKQYIPSRSHYEARSWLGKKHTIPYQLNLSWRLYNSVG